jgi:hypothetical protein
LAHIIHLVGAYSLFVGIFAQVVVLASGWKRGKTPEMVQASLLLLALGLDSAAIMLRPHQPPQLLPDLLGCGAALLLFAPAVEAVRKLTAKKKEDAGKSQGAQA